MIQILTRTAITALLLCAYSATTLVAQVSVTSRSGPFFIIDNKQSRNHLANYVGYRITNTSGSDYSDLYVRLSNFQGGVVSLANNEDGIVHLGALANGASTMAYFYLKASGESVTTQTHTLDVYEGTPSTPVPASPSSFSFVQTGDFAPVHTAIAASANKVDAVTISGTPLVGGTFTMTVEGITGVIGNPGDVLFSPATFPTWPADAFQLERSVIAIGSPPTLTFTDDLYVNLAGQSSQPYTLTYTFRVKSVKSGSTANSPLSYLTSGQKVKHEDLNTAVAGSVAEVFQVTLSMSSTPAVLEPQETDPDGGTVTYTITLTNPGTTAINLSRIVATLPDSSYGGGAPGDVTYGGNSTFGGSPISDPSISNATLTWTGPFTIPAGGSIDLTFDGVFPKIAGLYPASSISIYDDSGTDRQIDTTLDVTDNAPGQTSTVVSDVNLPVELVAFEAQPNGQDVLLRWETASETNNAGFEIQSLASEPALTNQAWTVHGYVQGHGTTALPQAYHYRVRALDPGRYRFRLKQIDYDGTVEYHPEVEVLVAVPSAFFLGPAYPNPFNPQAQFRLSVAQRQAVSVVLYNGLGQPVARLYEGVLEADEARVITIDGRGLPSGLYLYRVTGESFRESRSVLLAK